MSARIRIIPDPHRPTHHRPEVKNQPTHSSVVTYLGPNHDRFAEVFASLGTVVLPIQVVRARAQRALEF